MLKKLTAFLIFLIFVTSLISSDSKRIPYVNLKNLKNKKVNSKTFITKGKPTVINIWATWCKPCIQELSAINDVYADWQDQADFRFIACSIDNSRSSKKVAPFVKGRGWDYEIFLDINGDFKRALGVTNPPHTFVYDGEGNLIWQHNGYAPGDEIELFNVIKKAAM